MIMRVKDWVLVGLLGMTMMFGLRTMLGEELVLETDEVAKGLLPLDVETSRVAFETATFGMG